MDDATHPYPGSAHSIDDEMLPNREAPRTRREFVSPSPDLWITFDLAKGAVDRLGIAIPLLWSPRFQGVLQGIPEVVLGSGREAEPTA